MNITPRLFPGGAPYRMKRDSRYRLLNSSSADHMDFMAAIREVLDPVTGDWTAEIGYETDFQGSPIGVPIVCRRPVQCLGTGKLLGRIQLAKISG